ncbi:MAG: N-acetylmuramoyl-L-alanine amidase [Faecalimonas sp.]|nr:N-acetylmuramoyl-L-alanine amidase [Faecalimonas sp.]
MAVYNVHAGHCPQGQGAYGAVGLLQESVENRIVKDEVIRLLRQQGHTVYDCTCDDNTTQAECLRRIVQKCNQNQVALDVSIHLNSGRRDPVGDNSTGGVEVLNYDAGTKAVSDAICANIAASLGMRNRGTKYNKGLYVLANTKSPAILIECCFVDDADDVRLWNPTRCAAAIVAGMTGSAVLPAPQPPVVTAPPNAASDIQFRYCVKAGGRWYPEVTNLQDYAGVRGVPITDIAIGVNQGSVRYRVHNRGGGWLPIVNQYNLADPIYGYAGNGNVIDAVEVYYDTPADYVASFGYRKAKYRVSPVNAAYYDWQLDKETGGGQDGYAGAFGVAIDRFQISPD